MNKNIAHCIVCSEKTHCRFSLANIPHRLHSTESKFHTFLSPNLPNNMGDIWKIFIQNGCRFITHSPTISILCQYISLRALHQSQTPGMADRGRVRDDE